MQYFFILFFSLMIPLWSDEPIFEESTYNYMGEFFKMLITLAFVIVLIIVSVWFLKKMMGSRLKLLNQSNGIKILERRPLGQKTSLYIIDVLGKGMVISESPAGVHLISEFHDDIQIESLMDERQTERKSKPFSEILANQLKKLTPKKDKSI